MCLPPGRRRAVASQLIEIGAFSLNSFTGVLLTSPVGALTT